MQNKASIQLLLLANAVSQFAQGISMIAIPWYFINNLKQSALYNTLFLVVTGLTLVWAQYAGTLIDKYNRKHIFQGLCAVGLVVLSSVGFYAEYNGAVPLPLLFVVFGFTVLNYNIHYPALYALAQEYSSKDTYVKVNSLLEVQGQSTSMLSGAAAALLIGGIDAEFLGIHWFFEPWNIERIFLMDACTYLMALILLFFLKTEHVSELKRDMGSVWIRLKRGWQYLGQNREVLVYGLFSYFVFVTVVVHIFYLMHLYVSDYLHADGTSLAIAEVFHTIGALSAGVMLQKLLKRLSTVNVTLILMALCVVSFFMAAFTQSMWVYAPLCLALGFANSGIRISRVTVLFKLVPKEAMGRVTSVFQSANIFLRMILIALFHLPFFVSSPERAYALYVAFIALAMLPILLNYRRIAEAINDETKTPGVMPGVSRIK